LVLASAGAAEGVVTYGAEQTFKGEPVTGEGLRDSAIWGAGCGVVGPLAGEAVKQGGKALKSAAGKLASKGGKAAGGVPGRSGVPDTNPSGTYRPDTPLPRDVHGQMVPSSPYPHTQLGTEIGRKVGPYTAAREFGPDGKPIRDIHFTDHGRPNVRGHTNPHQHRHIPCLTGGTPEYGQAEPLVP
jgi:hypothetical protein